MSKRYKIVLLGEGRVGKTSLILRYVKNEFDSDLQSTIQATYLLKRVNLPSVGRVELAIWDTAGQERFHALGPIYYRDANGALLVYDVTDPPSFEKVKTWVKELRKMLGNNVVLCIAGNKTDLERNRRVSTEEAEAYASSVNAAHFLTSAKLGRGVNEVFLELAKRVSSGGSSSTGGSSLMSGGGDDGRNVRNPRSLAIVDRDEPDAIDQEESGCAC